MSTIKIEVISHPSRSKGWARYAVNQAGRNVVETTTGNAWVGGTTKEGQAVTGSGIEVRSQVTLNVGKGGRARKESYTQYYRMIVEEGVVTEIDHSPGSQGQLLRITGARLVGE